MDEQPTTELTYYLDEKGRRRCRRSNKLHHEKIGDAIDHLVRLLASPDCDRPDLLHAYPCNGCDGYHVGHAQDRNRARKPVERRRR